MKEQHTYATAKPRNHIYQQTSPPQKFNNPPPSLIILENSDNVRSNTANIDDEEDQDPLPTFEEFQSIVHKYLQNLSPKKRDKALVDHARYCLIQQVLTNPRNTSISTAQFRFWVKKMFQLLPGGSHLVCHDNRPVAMKEQIYGILVNAHREVQHGGRDKTSAIVKNQFSWIPKELVAQFVRQCPTCTNRRNGNISQPLSTYTSRVVSPNAAANSNVSWNNRSFTCSIEGNATAFTSMANTTVLDYSNSINRSVTMSTTPTLLYTLAETDMPCSPCSATMGVAHYSSDKRLSVNNNNNFISTASSSNSSSNSSSSNTSPSSPPLSNKRPFFSHTELFEPAAVSEVHYNSSRLIEDYEVAYNHPTTTTILSTKLQSPFFRHHQYQQQQQQQSEYLNYTTYTTEPSSSSYYNSIMISSPTCNNNDSNKNCLILMPTVPKQQHQQRPERTHYDQPMTTKISVNNIAVATDNKKRQPNILSHNSYNASAFL